MTISFKLSGENLKLSKAELEALFGCSAKLQGNIAKIQSNISDSKVQKLCESSAMIKSCKRDGVKIYKVEQGRFSAREPTKKTKFHPTVLKPKLARTLINLTGLKKGKILDPFCGTGSILIEAAILGLKPTGSDLMKKMEWYSRKNLEQYNLKADTFIEDATQLSRVKANSFDAIVTDPPYGRSSTLAGRTSQKIYSGFLKAAHRVLKPSKRLVFIRPNYLRVPIPSKLWKKLGIYDWYVHKSLTRKIVVLEKV